MSDTTASPMQSTTIYPESECAQQTQERPDALRGYADEAIRLPKWTSTALYGSQNPEPVTDHYTIDCANGGWIVSLNSADQFVFTSPHKLCAWLKKRLTEGDE